MQQLVILGASGLAREVCWYILEAHSGEVEPVFADDVSGIDSLRFADRRYPVVDDWRFPGAAQFVIGVGDPRVKQVMVEKALDAGLQPAPSIVHPAARICPDVRLGPGGIVAPGCIVSVGATLGDFVVLGYAVTIGHDAVLQDYVTCNPGAAISGGCRIGEGALVGARAAVREQLEIGPWSTVGMQACVVKTSHEPRRVLVGVPARVI